MTEFLCYFCGAGEADRLIYYTKFYLYSGQETIEVPRLCCNKCWDNRQNISYFYICRGGKEGYKKILFRDIGKKKKKEIGYLLSPKGKEMNDLASPFWRKTIFRIHYVNGEKKLS